jgi:hypothetical protein
VATTEGFRNRIVGLEVVPADSLKEHRLNWRIHPEKQRSALLAALDKIGIADAVLAYHSERDDGALTLIDGHLRRGLIQDIPVLVTDLTDDEADVLLASHDVITTMAQRDEEMLGELLAGIETEIPRDLMLAIDPDLEGLDEELDEDGKERPRYPIVPEFDEGYDSVIVFATSETDWLWLEKTLDLQPMRDRKKIGLSHVLTVNDFRRWLAKQTPAK